MRVIIRVRVGVRGVFKMRIKVSVRVRVKVRVRVRTRTLDIEAICSNHGKYFVGGVLYVHKNVVLVQKGVFGLRGYR